MRFLPCLALVSSILLFSACAKEQGDKSSADGVMDRHAGPVTGSVTESIKAIHSSAWAEPCDEKFRDAQFEIAAALDRRAAEIEAFAAAQTSAGNDTDYRPVKVGPLLVRERISPLRTTKGWTTEPYYWEEIVTYYQTMKDKPVGKEWVSFNGWVRGLLTDDVGRVVKGYNYGLDEKMGPALAQVAVRLAACAAKEGCTDPDFSPDDRALLDSIPDYRPFVKKMKELPELAERRAYVEKLKRKVDVDYTLYAFTRNNHMRQVAPGQFELAIDFGPFAEAAPELRGFIEPVWQNGSAAQLKVLLKDRRDYPDIFRILVGDNFGGRSFVSFGEDKKAVLNPAVRSRSIAHELGHVMGFPDMYFTVWDPNTCRYSIRTHMESLMGDSSDGLVLPLHWDELAKQYPLGK